MEVNVQIDQLEIFSGLKSTTIQRIINASKIIEVESGTMLIRYRESADVVYIQLTGKSIEYVLTHQGKRKILFILGKGAILNGYIFNDRVSSIYCETYEKSKLIQIPVDELTKIMANDFTLTKRILMYQEKKFGRLSHQLKNTTSSMSMEKKLLAKLWKLSKDFGVDTEYGREIKMCLSITFLADLLGTSRETTSRLCSNLVEDGLIKIQKKQFTILNPEQIALSYKTDKSNNTIL